MGKKDEWRAKYLDPRWQKLRLEVFNRDGWSCRVCHSKEDTLHAHHSYYRFGADPWDYPADAIITVCNECHEGEHANWECDEIREALCCNGFWSVYDRSCLAGALRGRVPDIPLSDDDAFRIIAIIEAFSWSVRHEPIGPSQIAYQLSVLANEAPDK